MSKIQCYICGSYTASTHGENLLNIRRAMMAGLRILEAKGWFPIVPHCSMNHSTSWETAMAICCATVTSLDKATDCVVMLPGWNWSKGAIEERDLAISFGIPVYELDEVLA